jgi:hypothetical protein
VKIHKRDKRDGQLHDAVDTEALGQVRIVSLLRSRLARLMPKARRDAVHEREAEEKTAVGRKLRYLKRNESS